MSKLKIQLHKSARRNFPRRPVIVKGLDDRWQAELVDMKAYSRYNKGHKYIVTFIDVFSTYAWAVAVHTKSGRQVTWAFAKILQENVP